MYLSPFVATPVVAVPSCNIGLSSLTRQDKLENGNTALRGPRSWQYIDYRQIRGIKLLSAGRPTAILSGGTSYPVSLDMFECLREKFFT